MAIDTMATADWALRSWEEPYAPSRLVLLLSRCYLIATPTSNVERVYPFQALLPAAATGLPRDSKAQAEQVRSVALERIGERIGVVPRPLMEQLDEALRLHLSL